MSGFIVRKEWGDDHVATAHYRDGDVPADHWDDVEREAVGKTVTAWADPEEVDKLEIVDDQDDVAKDGDGDE